MSDITKIVKEEAKELFPYASELRRYFHMHPEIATEEYNTAATIERELDAMGLAHARAALTGVYVDIRGELPGDKMIVLRADIDALTVTEEHDCAYKSTVPGKMHACGHDAHTAALLAAVRILNDHRDLFGGTVRAIFQPGEEIGYGAKVLLKEGLLEGADRTFRLPLASFAPVVDGARAPGPNLASSYGFQITVHGKSAHVSTPEQGVDALYIASRIVTGVQALITRRLNPMAGALIGIGKLTAGEAYNVVAAEAVLEGTVRAFLPEVRQQMHDQIEELAALTARSYGGTVDIEWKDFGCPLLNDEASCIEAQKTAARLFGEDKIRKSQTPSLGGDDFGELAVRVPGVYVFVGSANPEIPETMEAHHNSRFDIDERCLEISTALYAAYAMEYLNGEV